MSTMAEAEQDVRVEAEELGTRPTEAVAERASAAQMWRYSRYVHVGPGAEECDEGEAGTCANPLHFHAWVRLPNKFQHKDIREKAMAAKARKIRALKDPESDAYAVLEAELAEYDEGLIETVIDEIVAREWAADYLESVRDVEEREEFETITADRERYEALTEGESDKPEDEQSDEFRELGRQVQRYIDAIKDRVTERQEPRRQALRERGWDALLGLLREQRVERAGDQAFIHVYNEWTWFIGTLHTERHPATGAAHRRVWTALGSMEDAQPGTMWGAAPEVIEAIDAAFTELDAAVQRAVSGNS